MRLPVVRHAIAVGVRQVRVGVGDEFLVVQQAIAVTVEDCVTVVQRVEAMRDFPAIEHAICIGVGFGRVRRSRKLLAVAETVVVGVGQRRVEVQRELGDVIDTVAVGIAGCIVARRVEAVIDFPVVAHAIAIGVRQERIRIHDDRFDTVDDAVAVGVRIRRVGAERNLRGIVDAITIGVRIDRVRAAGYFIGGENPVGVGVDIEYASDRRLAEVELRLDAPAFGTALVERAAVMTAGSKADGIRKSGRNRSLSVDVAAPAVDRVAIRTPGFE